MDRPDKHPTSVSPEGRAASVRAAVPEDLPALTAIYNHYVVNTPATFDLEPLTLHESAERFAHYASVGRYRMLVAVDGDAVAGYASSGRLFPRRAYDTSVTTSVYLAPDATGRGLGTLLYEALFDALAGEDVHRAYAGITMPNPASVALHERFGLRKVAHFTEQGRKFDRYWDVAWYEKSLS